MQTSGTLELGERWRIELDGVDLKSSAVGTLRDELALREDIHIVDTDSSSIIHLTVKQGSVVIGEVLDPDKASVARQAYRLDLQQGNLRITANAEPGLYYGVQTLLQLVKHRNNHRLLPMGTIADWPDISLRQIYWDDAHHLESLVELKRAVKQASSFKINAFVIKLEGHFQYQHAPALVEPYALSPEALQDLTDYASHLHVQIIPYLDCPAHIAFILKHPEYAPLRAFADSNYELCVTNPASYELLFGMFQDLIDATRGSGYFYLSTDEPYYVGLADDPEFSEAKRQVELGSKGKLLAEFITRAAAYLHDHGRKVVFWGETPLSNEDVASLPPYVINGETGTTDFNAAFKARHIPQMLYTSTQGEEKYFPDYFVLPDERRLHVEKEAKPRVAEGIKSIADNPSRLQNEIVGTFVAGWGDSGLHPETFWLGYATLSAAGWNPRFTESGGATTDFMIQFYGRSVSNMERAYQLLSYQAQAWADSWETGPSQARKPIWGNSSMRHDPRKSARDQYIALPTVPSVDSLAIEGDWITANSKRLELASHALVENEELMGLLQQNLRSVEINRFNVEVMLSVARLCRHNWLMLSRLAHIAESFKAAHQHSADTEPAKAVASLDDALDAIEAIRGDRNRALRDATETYYTSWEPRVPTANGRTFLHEVDDVKDHLPDRTVGMEYLVYRELILPVEEWKQKLLAVRNTFARAHNLKERIGEVNWTKTN